MKSQTTNQLYLEVSRILSDGGIENFRREAAWLTAAFLGCEEEALHQSLPVLQSPDGLLDWAKRRAAGEPLQYILGTQEFMGLEIRVGKGVLIPRPETEALCRVSAYALTGRPDPVVLDLCAGSGCVSLGICSLEPRARVYAVEKFRAAMNWLNQNICAFSQYNVTPVCADILTSKLSKLPVADVIAANPPYIAYSEKKTLQRELFYEPERALFAEKDGLCFYEAIAAHGKNKLKPDGIVAVEIGYRQADQVCEIFREAGYRTVSVIKDDGKRDRVVKAQR